MGDDPGFTRSVKAIDEDLAYQLKRRDEGLNEITHGCFLVERSNLAIDRLIDERAEMQGHEVSAAGGG
jgi:hypothetical protein